MNKSRFRSYSKENYLWCDDGWKFLPDPRYRDQCDHVWVTEFIGIDGEFHRTERRCERWAKFQRGDVLLCGNHTPGYGRKGVGRVPSDKDVAAIDELRKGGGE